MERLTSSNKEIPTLTADNETYWLKVYFKLKEYEDLEEQGLLLKLPCKVGDTVYLINEEQEDMYDLSTHYYFIDECKFIIEMYNDIGISVFLTKAEAEKALAEMKGE